MSLINLGAGLSAAGNALSTFAGNAGLTAQKAELEKQQAILADKLATTREHVGRVEAGTIAADAALKRAGVETGLETQRTDSAEKIAGDNVRSQEKLEGGRQAEAHRHNVADESNSAIVAFKDADGNDAYLDKRTMKITSTIPPDMFDPLVKPTGGIINSKPTPTVTGSVESPKDAPVSDPVAATDRSPDRRPWLSAQADVPTDQPTEKPSALVYQGEYIKSLSPIAQERFASFAPQVQLELGPMLAGHTNPPESGRSQTDPHLRRLLKLAALVDPEFDEQKWRERNKAAVDLADTKSPGSTGGQRVAARTFLGHATDLVEAEANKNNTSAMGSAGNWIDNKWVQNTSPETEGNSTAKKTIQTKAGVSREGVVEELGKIVKGGPPTVPELAALSEHFPENSDISSVVGSVGEAADMMAKRINEQVNTYNMTMGTHETLEKWLGPESYRQYQMLTKLASDSVAGKEMNVQTVKAAIAAVKSSGFKSSGAISTEENIPPVPRGVTQTEWAHMTPDQRKLFQ